jgi:hypothetical protein
MPSIQRPHGGLAACRNRSDEIFVGLLVGRMKFCRLPAGQGIRATHVPLTAPRPGAPSAIPTEEMRAGSDRRQNINVMRAPRPKGSPISLLLFECAEVHK